MGTIEFEGQAMRPGKIVCIGKNYHAHIAEMQSVIPEQMVVFMKPSSAISANLRSSAGETLHYECEICLLLNDGKIVGVGVGLDLTKRELQGELKRAGLPWERSKAFDGSAVFSTFVPAPNTFDKLFFELTVNNAVLQRGAVTSMLYAPETIILELQQFLTLENFDVVMTGTPAGVGPVAPGDRFEAKLIDGESELVRAQWVAT